MATYWLRDCGHYEARSPWGDATPAPLSGLCRACRAARIGETIEFLRFGAIPVSGRSSNHRDETTEEGVSVYEIRDGRPLLVGWHFGFHGRAAYRGTGLIVGWGSDEEPLIRVISCRRVSRKAVAALAGGEDAAQA